MSSNKISGTGSSGSNSNSSSTHVLDNPLGYITNKLAIAAYASKEGVNVDGVMNVLSAEVDSQLLMIVQDAAKKAIHSRSGITLQHTNASEISLSSSSLSNDERYSNKNIYCNIQLRHLLWALVEPGDNNKSNNNGSANNNNNSNNNNSGSGSSSGGSSSNISTSVGNNNNNNNNSSSSSGSGNISIIRRPVPYAPNLNKYIRTQDVAQSNNGINDKISTSNQLTGFGRGRSDASIFFLKEPDVSIAELLSAATPSNAMNTSTSSMKTQGKALRISNKPPVSPGFRIHWLVVDGKQPSVPENPTQREIESMLKKDISLKRQRDNSIASVNRYGHSGNSNEGAITQPFGESIQARIIRNNPLLSKEHQIYFEKITSILETGQMQSNSSNNSSNESNSGSFQNENPLINSAIVSLANDAGLDGVVPHLVSFISEKVKSSFRSLRDLYVCMRASRALISNKNIKIDLYLHDLIPVIITCLVAKRLDDSADEDHWSLREYVAGVIRDACRIHGVSYPNLRPRILETLHGALSSMNKPLPTCYGAIVGIASLGPIAVESQLLPLVPSIVDRLDKYPKGSSKAIEAQYVLNALQRAVGVFFNYKISQRILMNQTYGSAFSPIDLENIAMELSEPLHPFVSLVMWNESSNFLDLSL